MLPVNPAQLLSQLPEGQLAHIQQVQMDNPTRIRLLGLGLGKGTRIEVLRNRQGDIVLGSGNNRISIGRSIARHIWVQQDEQHG